MQSVEDLASRCRVLSRTDIARLASAWLSRHYSGGKAIPNPVEGAAKAAIARDPRSRSWEDHAGMARSALCEAIGAPLYAWPHLDDQLPEGAALAAVRDAALAIQARDVLDEQQFDELLAPWRETQEPHV